MKKFDEPCENCMAETTGQCADKFECGEWQCYRELMKYQGTELTPEEDRELAAALSTPGRLEQLKQLAIDYGAKADFYRRAEAAVDYIEEAAHAGNR